MTITFDSFLDEQLGSLGCWHWLFMLSLTLVSEIPLHFFGQFIFLLPQHHCHQPQLVNFSWKSSDIINLTIPFKSNPQSPPMIGQSYHPCKEYNLDNLWPSISPNTTLSEAIELRSRLVPNLTTRSCAHDVSFDLSTTVVRGTFGTEFSIVCQQSYYIPLSNIAYFSGLLLGYLIGGPLANYFGRRMVCLSVLPITIACGLGTAFVQDKWTFMVLRLITATGISTVETTHQVLVSEWLTATQRNLFQFVRKACCQVLSRSYVIFCIFIMPNWRYAYIMYFAICFPALIGYFVWLESPRWLLSHGQVDKTHKLLVKVMRWNRILILPEASNDMKAKLKRVALTLQGGTETHKRKFFTKSNQQVKHKKIVRLSLTLALISLMHTLLYFGLSFNAIRLNGNPFLIGFCNILMCIPGNTLQLILYRLFDRKRPMIVLYALCSLALLTAFVSTLLGHRGLPTIVPATIGLCFAEGLYTMLSIRTPELLPTSVRSVGTGASMATASLGMMLAMYAERLDELVWIPLPLLLFSISALAATVLSMCLPAGCGEMKEWDSPSVDATGMKDAHDLEVEDKEKDSTNDIEQSMML